LGVDRVTTSIAGLEGPQIITTIEMLFVKLPELCDLTTRHGLENELVIWGVFDEFIQFWYCALAIPFSQPLQKISSNMITRVPASPTGTPMRGHETGTEADPIYHVREIWG
jgi:hypothetical protein